MCVLYCMFIDCTGMVQNHRKYKNKYKHCDAEKTKRLTKIQIIELILHKGCVCVCVCVCAYIHTYVCVRVYLLCVLF